MKSPKLNRQDLNRYRTCTLEKSALIDYMLLEYVGVASVVMNVIVEVRIADLFMEALYRPQLKYV